VKYEVAPSGRCVALPEIGTPKITAKVTNDLPMDGSCWLFTHLQLHEMLSVELRGVGPAGVGK